MLTGAPENPIRGTFPLSCWRVKVIASPTYFRSVSTFGEINLDRCDGSRSGFGNTGP